MTTNEHRAATCSSDTGEQGVALVYALLIAVIVAGVVAVTFAAALGETRQSAFELNFEDTLHVAEAGAEAGLQEVFVDKTVTNASDPAAFAGDESEWAIAEASDTARPVDRIGGGESVWLRPSTGSTEFVYGVGFVPTRAAYLAGARQSYVRVVRMEVGFTDSLAPGTYAFLSDRILTFNGGGNSSVYGTNGSVHTNGSLNPPSSSGFSFSGTVSYHECSGCGNPPPAGYSETNTVVPVNAGTPETIYATETARDYLTGGGDWYDYCGGQWYQRVAGDDEVPCSGDETARPSGVPGFASTNQQGNGAAGVYWFAGSPTVSLSSDDVVMTVITGGDINLPNGNPTFEWVPAYPALHAYAGGNIDWNNADVNTSGISCSTGGLTASERAAAAAIPAGIVYAANNIVLSGNASAAQISFIADNDIVFNGGGPECIVLETDAAGDLGGAGEPVVVQWDELG